MSNIISYRIPECGTPTPPDPVFYGSNPIISPSLAFEEIRMGEGNMLYDNGKFRQWYNFGWTQSGVGYAESTDGLSWTRLETPMLGLGYGGETAELWHASVNRISGVYYLIATNAEIGNGPLVRYVSSDGLTWSGKTTILPNDAVPNVSGWANNSLLLVAGTWYLLAEGLNSGTWRIFAFSSSDGLTFSPLNSGMPLSTLEVASGGMYGGPSNVVVSNGVFHLWYHAAPNPGLLPTNIYKAHSSDLVTWSQDGLVLQDGGMEFENGQISDPCICEAGGESFLFYSATDSNNPPYNASGFVCLAAAKYAGPLSEVLSGSGSFTRVPLEEDRSAGSDPVEYWELSESSGPRTGSVRGLDMLPVGTVSTTTGVDGNPAVSISGAGTLQIESNEEIQIGNHGMTYSAFFRCSALSSSPIVLCKTATGQEQMVLDYSSGHFRLSYFGTEGDGSVVHDNGITPTDGEWVFLIATFDVASKALCLWLNGKRKVGEYRKSPLNSGTAPLSLGGDGTSNASVRDFQYVGYWKRALSDIEAFLLPNGMLGRQWPFSLVLPTIDPITQTWIDKCIYYGGPVSDSHISVADSLVVVLKSKSYYSKITYLLPMLGGTMDSLCVPLVDPLDAGRAANTLFVDSDISPTRGLVGGRTGTRLTLPISPSASGTGGNGGIGWYGKNSVFLGGYADSPLGIRSGGGYFELSLTSTTATFRWGNVTGITGSVAQSDGFYYGQRSSSSNRSLYKDGAQISTSTTSDTTPVASARYYSLSQYAGGTYYDFHGDCLAVVVTDGTLTSDEAGDLYVTLNTHLITPLQR